MNIKVKQEIINYSLDKDNEEVCGFICYDNLGRVYVEKCYNYHINKRHAFEIDPNTYIAIKSKYNIYGIFHSHVSESLNFSKRGDISLSESLEIPIYLFNVKNDVWKEYMPKSLSTQLLERPFVWGLCDCWELVRIYYWKRLHIYLTDYDRDEKFEGFEINEDNIKKEGFEEQKIENVSDIKDHDIILSMNYKQVYGHLGIYCNGTLFEHRQNRLSENRLFVPNLSKMRILRYKNLI